MDYRICIEKIYGVAGEVTCRVLVVFPDNDVRCVGHVHTSRHPTNSDLAVYHRRQIPSDIEAEVKSTFDRIREMLK